MMEMPNYSSQLLQQLWALRREGVLCDCTILVGEGRHRAHKLLLAASSMLFRSLLDRSDTVSIDTSLVSSQDFAVLLDLVYTGRLPLGQHNVSRMVAAAHSLQMFDVAAGFKGVLESLARRQGPHGAPPAELELSADPDPEEPVRKRACRAPAGASEPEEVEPAEPEEAEPSEPEEAEPSEPEEAEPSEHGGTEPEEAEPSEPEEAEPSECGGAEPSERGGAEPPETAALLKGGAELKRLLSSRPSVTELLRSTAQRCLDPQDTQVVCGCCEDSGSSSVLDRLLSKVEGGLLSGGGLAKLLQALQDPPLPPPLQPVLEEAGRSSPDGGGATDKHPTADSSPGEGEEEGEAKPSPPAKPFACCWCQKSFDYRCRLAAHTKRCSLAPGGRAQCPDCPQSLANQRALQRHRSHAHRGPAHPKKKVPCDLCGRTFAHPSGMIYHKRTEHFEEKPFSCQECGAKFGANSSLKNHQRLHTGEKPYQCRHCALSFSVAAALAYHTKRKHSEGKMYVCQYCKAVFAQAIELTRHVRTHTGDRPYVCRECGKGYSQASGLTVHLHTCHHVSGSHDCQKCCLSFPSPEEHQQHLERFHPKDVHRCPACSKVFTSAALLDKHRAVHSGAKPYSCTLCNRSYQQMSGLWYHNRTTHPEVYGGNTRPLRTLVQCDACFKFFPSAPSLAKHRAAEHQGPEVVVVGGRCPFCPVALGDDEELQEHLLACHMEAPQLPGAPQGAEQQEEEAASTSYMVVAAQAPEAPEEGSNAILLPEEGPRSPAGPQHLLLALSGGPEVPPARQVVEVNMYELLGSSVAFVCQDKTTAATAETPP